MTIDRNQTFRSLVGWKIHPLIPILIIGFILRVISIGSRGIWYDDAFSILLSNRSLGEIISGTAADTMPPVYYFLLHFWGMISQQIWFLRILNIGLSLIIVVVIFQLVTLIAGKTAGSLAAILTAISPFQIYHAQEIRMYTILELALMLHMYFFLRYFVITNTGHKNTWIMIYMVLTGALALYSHNLAIFTLAALDGYLIYLKEWKKLASYVLAQIIMGIIFLPWLIYVPGQIEKIQTAFWTPKPGLVQVIQSILALLATLPLGNLGIYTTALAIALVIVVLFMISSKTQSNRQEIILVKCLIFIPPSLLFIASWFMRPVFVPRAFIVSGLMIYVLVGIILSEALSKHSRRDGEVNRGKSAVAVFAIGLLVLISAISLPFQYTFHSFPRSDFKQLMVVATDGCANSCIIVHDNKLSYFPSIIYDKTPNQVFIADPAGSHNDTLALASQKAMNLIAKEDIQDAVDTQNEIRFVVFSKAIYEYGQMGNDGHPIIKWLGDQFTLIDHKIIGDLELYYYRKHP